jgi:hypothetical protein
MSTSISTKSAAEPAAQVFYDDFNDGNIDDWITFGFNSTSLEDAVANFTLSDGSLRAQGENGSYAAHACPVSSVGTWRFDVDCVSTSNNHFTVAFISGVPTNDTSSPTFEYGLTIVTGVFDRFDTEFVLYRRDVGSIYLSNVIGRYNLETVSGWYHIDVTRNAIGMFKVYFNGTLGISGADGMYDTAEYFAFHSVGGPAIDNVNVTNTIDIDPDPPVLNNPGFQEILDNETFFLDLEASDYSGISTWWLNDTEHFTIDTNGDIENATILTEGLYGIQVSVNDTSNNIQTIEFTLNVTASTTGTTGTGTYTGEGPGGFDTMTLFLIAGGSVVIIIVLVVVIKSKKS